MRRSRVKKLHVVVCRSPTLLLLLKPAQHSEHDPTRRNTVFKKRCLAFIGIPVTEVEHRLYVCMHTSSILRAIAAPVCDTRHSVDSNELNCNEQTM